MNIERGTERLIAQLGAGLAPVRPLRPPVVRALLWLALAAALALAAMLLLPPDFGAFRRRAADPRFALELGATALTGIVAIIAACHLAIPGREGRWALAPLPPLALWLACSGLGCLQNGIGGTDYACLYFVLAASVPLGLSLLWLLRRARPLSPLPVALVGGLGVAAIGAFLLQFFHPFDVTVIDLATHALAVALVVVAFATGGSRLLDGAQRPQRH